MNFGDLETYHERTYQWPPHTPIYDPPVTPLNVRLEADRSPSITSSISDPATVIQRHTPPISSTQPSSSNPPRLPLPPFETPPNLQYAPTPPLYPSNKFNSKYLLKNHLRNTNCNPQVSTPRRHADYHDANRLLFGNQLVSRDEIPSSETRIRRMLAGIDDGPDSPTPVDSTPYIRFALDQLTKHETYPQNAQISASNRAFSDDYPVNRIIPELELTKMHLPRPELISNLYGQGLMDDHAIQCMTPEKEREALTLIRKHRSNPRKQTFPDIPEYDLTTEKRSQKKIRTLFLPASTPPSVSKNPITNLTPAHVPLKSIKNPPLNFVPMILRPLSLLVLAIACISMLVLLILCAVFSRHDDLMNWYGRGSSQREFFLRFGPPIFATMIFLHVQSVMGAITRIMPFALLAQPTETRGLWNKALFSPLYPIMLRPARVGNHCIDICMFIFWFSVLTVPLQSSIFSARTVSGRQRCFTVEIVAWVLVIIYTLLLGAVFVVGSFFFRRSTGLLWDPRSIADIIAMLPHCHSLSKFAGTDILRTKRNIFDHLGTSNLRLGYWSSSYLCGSDLIYGFSEEPTNSAFDEIQKSHRNLNPTKICFRGPTMNDIERGILRHDRRTRLQYLPWYLQDVFLWLWSVAAIVFWVGTLLVVSILLPMKTVFETRLALIRSSAVDVTSSNSLVNFLMSFGPSLVGMLLYLLFQPLDMTVRILKPWAELSRAHGATADESLLLDYPASYPIHVSLSAYAAGHYRVGTLSLFSTLFLLLPILAGGLFDPHFILPTTHINQVRLNLPVLVLVVCLLTLYLIGILLLFSHHHRIALPHGTFCLAEIISFIHNSHILNDAAFNQVRSKTELTTRLLSERTSGGFHRWAFGLYKGRDGNDSFGIERIGRNPGVGLMVMGTRLLN